MKLKFDLTKQQRKIALREVLLKTEAYYAHTKDLPIAPDLLQGQIIDYIEQADLQKGNDLAKAISFVTKGLENYSVHTPHPKYFGLFNPRPNFAGILADLITAAYNPQLAAWSHAPYAAEVEIKLIKEFSKKFGYQAEQADGVFASGGAEANLTAVLCALNHKYPDFAKDGVFSINKRPIIFCSAEAHHSVQKAAKVVGLGYDSIQTIPINKDLKLDAQLLKKAIKKAKKQQQCPLMIIGTAGTTGAGTIDDLQELSKISKQNNLWFHVDAAYGGAALLSSKWKTLFKGIELSDSITFDAHKWMSVPMAASLFLTSHKNILAKTYRITTEYMPKEANKLAIIDPFTHSIQWSRRFIGLKVYLSLLFYGWKGYEKVIDKQIKLGHYFREKLVKNGWIIKNNTSLPVICFTDNAFENDPNFTKQILDNIIAKKKSWLSLYPIQNKPTFRVCIINYQTKKADLRELIAELNLERSRYKN
jgi:glutamate/tyrosine decarboxylase-like PLP-dependent enzyme